MIKALVVDDSPVIREFLVHVMSSDPQIEVAGTAANGEEAVKATIRLKPDVITMDVNMPEMDGFEATRKIMESCPTPIVIVSGSTSVKETATAFKAVEVGALAVVARPPGADHPEYEAAVSELITTVKLMAEVRVVKRWPKHRKTSVTAVPKPQSDDLQREIKIVAIGTSTGGPQALLAILSGLSRDFPIPLLIVQHMAPGFMDGFIEWLSQSSGPLLHLAKDGEHPQPGHAYIAPDGFHMTVKNNCSIVLDGGPPREGLRPSVSALFESVANVYGGDSAGVLLTGMGRDGARELKIMKDMGAVTIAQDDQSSIVFGMPYEAVKLGAATYVLPLDRIAPALKEMVTLTGGGQPYDRT